MNWDQPKVYAAKHMDGTVVSASRSGGFFTAVSDLILARGGVIYGCVLTDDFEVIHARTEDEAGRDLMRGSKYVQSKMGNAYKMVKTDLDSGRSVLFTGTSCQIAGLRGFLGKAYDKLTCVDLVCHGVPSQLVWKTYVKWQEERVKAKVVLVDFRNKSDFGWREHRETLYFNNGDVVSMGCFSSIFYTHNAFRPSCYECPFKSTMHPGDITIADCWGVEKAAPELDDNKGVSLILVNNDVGASVFEHIKKDLIQEQIRIEDVMQGPLMKPCQRPDTRDVFWNDFREKSFTYVAKKYGAYGFKNRFKRLVTKIRKKSFGS